MAENNENKESVRSLLTSSKSDNVLRHYISQYFGKYLADDSINEICYNGGNIIWCEDYKGEWLHEESNINYDVMYSFATTCAAYMGQVINNNSKPILSGVLPNGERIQIVCPPIAKHNHLSITIRKPSKTRYKIEDYIRSGIIDERLATTIQEMVRVGKNVVICGETGSGKTTFMKTLIDFIPLEDRLITIEDVEEIKFWEHKNFVQLFYPSEAKSGDAITPSSLLKSCLRMKPSRILLAEVRSGETYDFLNVMSSGHDGSMTSCHAGSIDACVDRLVMMSLQNHEARALGKDMLIELVHKTVDVIVVLKKVNKKRMVVEYKIGKECYRNDGNGNYYAIDVKGISDGKN